MEKHQNTRNVVVNHSIMRTHNPSSSKIKHELTPNVIAANQNEVRMFDRAFEALSRDETQKSEFCKQERNKRLLKAYQDAPVVFRGGPETCKSQASQNHLNIFAQRSRKTRSASKTTDKSPDATSQGFRCLSQKSGKSRRSRSSRRSSCKSAPISRSRSHRKKSGGRPASKRLLTAMQGFTAHRQFHAAKKVMVME